MTISFHLILYFIGRFLEGKFMSISLFNFNLKYKGKHLENNDGVSLRIFFFISYIADLMHYFIVFL